METFAMLIKRSLACLLGAAFCCGLVLPCFSTELFEPYAPQPVIEVGEKPNHVAAAQLGADSRLDLAVACSEESSIRILHNHDGVFVLDQIVPAEFSPWCLAIGDFNADGSPDIVSSDADSMVTLYLADAQGQYASLSSYPVGPQPKGMATGDFDGDLKDDLAVAVSGGDQIAVLYNRGGMGFDEVQNHYCGSRPTDLLAGNLDGDTELELVVVRRYDGILVVMQKTGDGDYVIAETHASPPYLEGAAIKDLDADEDLDIVSVSYYYALDSGFASVLVNNGLGAFTFIDFYSTGQLPTTLLAEDFDGNSVPDLVIDCLGAGGMDVFLGQGGAEFLHDDFYEVGLTPRWPEALDFDLDGDLDLAIACREVNQLCLMQNNSDPLTSAPAAGVPGYSGFLGAAPNPFNPSVRLDFTLASAGELVLSVFDCSGRWIRDLYRGPAAQGAGNIEWDGRDSAGRQVAGGVYLARLAAGESVDVLKLVLLK